MSDTIMNKPLSGTELKQIIMSDVERMLDMDSMLQAHYGYGRVSYQVNVKLLLDNPAYPEHTVKVSAKPNKANPQVAAAPVKEVSAEVVKMGRQRSRNINNPNLERVKHGLAIEQSYIDPADGKTKTRELEYTPEQAGISEVDADPDNGTVDKELSAMEIDL